jgi:hypothetical protein
MTSIEWTVLVAVTASRLLLPLAIPRYPLAAILAALLLDGIDQTVFQQFAPAALEGYQGYDKALDIYYLTIAYISTMRNWENRFALRLARLLFYLRLVGVALFEITDVRWLLLVFPNTFEYFFIFYEAVLLRWDPKRLRRRALQGVAALIWIVIKVPQEYWLHIAQKDTTDWSKTELLGFPETASWLDILAGSPGLLLAAGAALLLAALAAVWLVRPALPRPHRRRSLRQKTRRPRFSPDQERRAVESETSSLVDEALMEKVVLISLVSISFAQVLPGRSVPEFQLVAGLSLVVVVNTAIAHWFARMGHTWALSMRQFIVLGAVNAVLAVGHVALRPSLRSLSGLVNSLFFALLLTLLVTLFDYFRQVYLMRFEKEA